MKLTALAVILIAAWMILRTATDVSSVTTYIIAGVAAFLAALDARDAPW